LSIHANQRLDINDKLEFNENLLKLGRSTASLFNKDTLDEVYDEVFEILQTVLNHKWVGIGKITCNQLVFIRSTTKNMINKSLSLTGKGITVRAVNEGENQIVMDTMLDPDYLVVTDDAPKHSEVDILVKINGHVKYVINTESPDVDGFNEDEIVFLELLGIQMEAAINNVLLKTRNIEYIGKLQAISKAIAAMDLCETLDELVKVTLDIVERVIEVNQSGFLLVESGKLDTISVRGAPKIDIYLGINGAGITSKAAREKKPIMVKDTRLDPDFVRGSTDSLSELAVPVFVDGIVIGVINLESLEPHYFREEHLQMSVILAKNLGNNIRRLENEKKVLNEHKQVIEAEMQLEKTREINKIKTEFIRVASHEIRTPLTSIKGYVDLLKDGVGGNLPETAEDFLEVISRNLKRLEVLTDDLLESQRLETGRIILKRKKVDLDNFIYKVRKEITPILEEKKQILLVNVEQKNVFADFDALRITQVLINLLTNASKFSPVGSTIELNCNSTNGVLKICIRDYGLGLDEQDITKLFNPFPNIRRENAQHGSGLGLSICKGLVKLHNGEIWAESEGRDRGSMFCFTLPIDR